MPLMTPETMKRLPRLFLSSRERRSFLNRLALDPNSWPSVRSAVRILFSMKPFSQSALELFGEWESQEIDIEVPDGFFPCNPSIVRHQGELYCNVRAVNYLLGSPPFQFEDGSNRSRSKNYLLSLSEDLAVKTVVPLVHPSGDYDSHYEGLEDLRLISLGEELWASYTVADRHPSEIRQIAVSKIALDGVIEKVNIQAFEGYKHQKNWMPFLHRGDLGWVYQCSPTLALKYDSDHEQAREWQRWGTRMELSHQRGSSQLLPWDDGFLCVTHEAHHGRSIRYLHRFLEFGPDLAIRKLSDAFYFERNTIEFCAGLCHSFDGRDLILSFGVEDRKAMLGRISSRAVKAGLKECLPSIALPRPHHF